MTENVLCPTTMFLEIDSRRLPLEPGQLYLLGKETNANKDFVNKYFIHLVDKDEVNRKHCVIDIGHSDDIYIYDLFSSQGTFLNNRLIKSLEKVRLKNGDVIKVGQQEIKFYYQQSEVSRDSSGFLEVNKNTSDIITSSPESTSQLENGSKRTDNNNFLVPSIPSRKSAGTPNTSIVGSEFDGDKSRNSLNISSDTSNRRSGSFTIPDTQYCKPRISLNGSDYSIAESVPETNASKIKFNFGNIEDDDEFCIPETQEAMPVPSSQRPRLLSVGIKPQEQTVIEERTSELEAEDSTKEIDGSQFRICTQDYNEGFGEETGSVHSQIIPLIKHKAIVLNTSSVSVKDTSKIQTQLESDKEISAIKWYADKGDQETTSLRPDCPTPDIFDFDDIEQNKQPCANEQIKKMPPNVLEEDEEDLLPTQVFSLEKSKPIDKKTVNIVDKPCLEKENEEVLTLSDKENRCPVTLDPVTDFPPTQLFATNEAPSVRSALSNSSRSSGSSAAKLHSFTTPAPTSDKPTENKNNPNLLLNLDLEDEDDLLTQAFLLPSKPATTSTSTSNKTVPVKCFNSTLLDGKSIDKNPAVFFAELEKAPLKQISSKAATDIFKVPDKEFLVPRKTSSAASTASDNDLDLLMCTPLLIKERLQVDKEDDLRKNILAVKNKDLFGDDTDEEETNDDQTDLVKLINVPKDSKDFDKLLPHLKSDKEEIKKKENEEEKLAKETEKKFKFNIPFGKELETQQSTTSKSSKSSRDERHMARDREREREEKMNAKRDVKEKTVANNVSDKQGRTRKRNKSEVVQNVEHKKSKDSKQNRRTEKERLSSEEDSRNNSTETKSNHSKQEKIIEDNNKSIDTNAVNSKRKKGLREKKGNEKQTKISETASNSCIKSEESEKPLPVRRMTRSKSINENIASTASSADHINKSKTKASHNEKESGDGMDSVSTQPFVRIRRGRPRSKNSESQHSLTSSSSISKSAHNDGSDISLSYNTSLNGSVANTLTEGKRKVQPTLDQPPAKIERKRLRSTHSLDSKSSSLTSIHAADNVCISMTMVDPELFKELVKKSNGFWNIATNPAESEILIMDKAFRTFKFLLAMARGIPIVTSDYLRKINEMQSIKKVPIVDYLFSDPEFEKKHKFSLMKSLEMAQKQKIFKGYEFLMTANILPNPSEIKAIIEASGGLIHRKSPPEPKEGQKIYLVSSADDKKEWHKYRRLNKNIVIVSTEAIMSAIMRQTCVRMSNYELS